MLVRTSQDSRDHLGLFIGTSNARRYFPKGTPTIDLRLGDLEIQCTLSPDFWMGRPEIFDPRLSEWLEFKVGRARSRKDPTLFTMAPSRSGTFVVKPRTKKKLDEFGEEIPPPRKIRSESYFSVDRVPALESFVA